MKKAYKLIKACKESLEYAIYKLRPNILLSTYGKEVEKKVNEYGYSIIKSLTGHGVGYEYHEAPYIFNFYHPNNDVMLEPNMVLALELMITNGTDQYAKEKDGWTLSTPDYSLAVHFEHTVLITNSGVEILGIKNNITSILNVSLTMLVKTIKATAYSKPFNKQMGIPIIIKTNLIISSLILESTCGNIFCLPKK